MLQIKNIEQLKHTILEKGYTYREFAKKIKCSQTHVSLILKGLRNPSAKLGKNICKTLELNFNDIFLIQK